MSVSFFFCGDIVNFTNNPNFIDSNLRRLIKESDVAIANFEAPIKTERMNPIPKAGTHISQSKDSIKFLKDAGFTMVSLANNHIYDYGQHALEATLEEIKKNDLLFVGAGVDFEEAYKTRVIEKNGIKIGVVAGCENEFGCLYEKQERGGYAWILHQQILDNIQRLRSQVDFIVLIVHAGVENVNIPIKEWREVYKRFCDMGVDVIIGHHPHIPQGYEKHNDSLIFYSLGNFYFDTLSFKDSPDDSYSVIVEFHKKKIIDYKIICHKKVNGITCLMDRENVSFNIEELNSLLYNDYERINNEICVELFNKYYYKYYKNAVCNTFSGLLEKIFLRNKKDNYSKLLLLHNIKIDSHRFVVQRALSLLTNAP